MNGLVFLQNCINFACCMEQGRTETVISRLSQQHDINKG